METYTQNKQIQYSLR